MRSIRRLVCPGAMLAICACLSAPMAAQDLQEGEWSGSIRNPPPRNANPRPASLIVEKGPDPLWRWRGGTNEITTITFTAAQMTAAVDEIQVVGGRLSYSFSAPGVPGEGGSCELSQQPDGRYVGECRPIFNGVLITLSPPEEADTGTTDEETADP